jgi:archaellum component FlaC
MSRPEDYIIFEDFKHLMEALCYCPGIQRFPASVWKTSEIQWAINNHLLDGIQKFDERCEQFGWRAQRSSVADPANNGWQEHKLRDMLSSKWNYRDPLFLNRDRERGEHEDNDSLIIPYDPADSKTQYLLGAKDEQGAQELLHALTHLLTVGIEAVPFPLAGAGTDSPFRYFWKIRSGRPNYEVLKMAERAWWGPVSYDGLGEGELEIFEEWPYHLELPAKCLHKIDWGEAAGVVLLSREEPQVLVTRAPEDFTIFEPLEELSNLEVKTQRTIEMQRVSENEGAEISFEVELKLVNQDPHRALERSINDLDLDIRAKGLMRDAMRQRAQLRNLDTFVPEPLLLYIVSGDEVPLGLRYLLAEWTDQREDIGALRYQKIEAASWPGGPFKKGETIHVMTTARALDGEGNSNVGLQLREYRFARYEAFDLLPDWADCDLRLFVPHRLHLSLYPEFRPGEVAVKKLAQALFPADHTDPGKWVGLLMPSNDGRITAIQLAAASFKPLKDSFQWDCKIDLGNRISTSEKQIAARDTIIESIDGALVTGVVNAATARLKVREDILMKSLETAATRMDNRQEVVTNLQIMMDDQQALFNHLQEFMTVLNSSEHRAGRSIEPARKLVQALQDKMKEIDELEKKLNIVKSKTGKAATLLDEIRQRIRRLWR